MFDEQKSKYNFQGDLNTLAFGEKATLIRCHNLPFKRFVLLFIRCNDAFILQKIDFL